MKSLKLKFMNGDVMDIDIDGLSFSETKKKIMDKKDQSWAKNYKTVRLVHAGKIIATDQEFNLIGHGEVVIVMGVKEKTIPSSSPSSSPNMVNDLENSSELNPNKVYNFRCCYAAMITFLSLVKSNPKLNTAFNNDFQSIITEFQTGGFKTIVGEILDQSESIAIGMEQGRTIALQIKDDKCERVENIVLDDNDKANIENMVDAGFDRVKVVQFYLKNKKDIDKTLMDLMS